MPQDAARILAGYLEAEPVEVCGVLCLTTQHEPLAFHEVSRGSLDATTVHPREVFKPAILVNAASIIVAHYVSRHIMGVMCLGSLCAHRE